MNGRKTRIEAVLISIEQPCYGMAVENVLAENKNADISNFLFLQVDRVAAGMDVA